MTEDWEAAKARIAAWEKARQEGPAPAGMKRCMNCYKVMDYDEQCECLRETGREIRAKAAASLAAGPEKEPAKKRTEKKKKDDQGSLFR